MYQWYEFKSRRGKNKNCTAQQSNSNTVWFNFQAYIYIYILIDLILLCLTPLPAIFQLYHGEYIYIYIYVCVSVCLYVYVCLWHVSIRIFNLFMTPLRKIRLRAFVIDNNQLALKCIKKTCHTIFGLDVVGRLVDNGFKCQTNGRQSQNQSKTDIYVFSVIFFVTFFCHIFIHTYEIKRNVCE